MATSTDAHISLLSPDQEQALAEIVSEHFGLGLSYAEFLDRLRLLCEDIAALEARSLPREMKWRIWDAYCRQEP